jgi:hypothetical protein
MLLGEGEPGCQEILGAEILGTSPHALPYAHKSHEPMEGRGATPFLTFPAARGQQAAVIVFKATALHRANTGKEAILGLVCIG